MGVTDDAASRRPAISDTLDVRLRHAGILVELGELYDAETEVEETLEEHPEDLTALDLLAKVKHMRGELSEAIACWTQVHEKAPRAQGALIHLSSLLQFARESERGPGNYVALGPFQIWKKPAALLELERAFRLFLEQRPDEARQRCEEIARKYRATDVDPDERLHGRRQGEFAYRSVPPRSLDDSRPKIMAVSHDPPDGTEETPCRESYRAGE